MKQYVYSKLLNILRSKGFDILRKTPSYIIFTNDSMKEIFVPSKFKQSDIPTLLQKHGLSDEIK